MDPILVLALRAPEEIPSGYRDQARKRFIIEAPDVHDPKWGLTKAQKSSVEDLCYEWQARDFLSNPAHKWAEPYLTEYLKHLRSIDTCALQTAAAWAWDWAHAVWNTRPEHLKDVVDIPVVFSISR